MKRFRSQTKQFFNLIKGNSDKIHYNLPNIYVKKQILHLLKLKIKYPKIVNNNCFITEYTQISGKKISIKYNNKSMIMMYKFKRLLQNISPKIHNVWNQTKN